MVRLGFDAACIVLSVIMLIRLRPLLQPGAFAGGAIFISTLWVGNTLLFLWEDPGFMFDVAMGACVLVLSLVSKFHWEAVVPAEDRLDGVEGVIRGSRPLQAGLVVLLLTIAFGMEAVVQRASG